MKYGPPVCDPLPPIYFLGLGNPAMELRVIVLNARMGCAGRDLVEIALDGLTDS